MASTHVMSEKNNTIDFVVAVSTQLDLLRLKSKSCKFTHLVWFETKDACLYIDTDQV